MSSTLPELASLPARPPSEVEWEELLVRLEIAPRALAIPVEETPAADPDVISALRSGVQRERELRAALEAMHAGRQVPPPAQPEPAADVGELLEELTRLRARNFAFVQRRGVEVWGWRAEGGPFGGATAYQILQAVVRGDREMLERVRRARTRGAAC